MTGLSFGVLAGAVVLAGALASQQPAPIAPPFPAGDIEHGRYVVEDVVHCAKCHSPRDAQGNIRPNERFEGAPIPVEPPWPNNWASQAPRNKGLPGYPDELAFRLFTEGSIGRDGTTLRPPMPRFRMTRQDAADVIAYMRSVR